LDLSHQTGTPAHDVKFTVTNGAIKIVAPASPGATMDVHLADLAVRRALLADINEVTLPVLPVQPTITEETLSGLHLTDKIATGQSNFSGSTVSRIQNITTAAALYNGILIPAGKVFSFNDILGEVDAEHGYAPEKVIKNGKIEYEYGGGICQVSTTMFRAAMEAGFPIVERKNHAFPVHYYEPQGYDATIYPGVSDLRFKNDSPSYVLVQMRTVGKNLYFDFYGTSDGRVVTIDGPHQYDIQPDGAMKAVLTRTISFADGASKSQAFYSNYKSPSLFPTEPNPYL
jgi:vancomycin resistance protein YoaR